MPLGAEASPPMAYVQFCERQPGDCNGVTAPELGRMRLAAAVAESRTAVGAISYDWSAAFAEQGVRVAQPERPAVSSQATADTATPVTFNWTPVFWPDRKSTPQPPSASTAAPMNPNTWSLLERINTTVNVEIAPRDDETTYGVADYWATPLENGVKYGDCEDYVLEKRHQLIAAGLPASALSIAVVLTERGESHAVLLVATSTGDYVLDNRTPWVLPWTQTSYRWLERQVAGSPSSWAFPAVARAAPRSGPARFLLASAR